MESWSRNAKKVCDANELPAMPTLTGSSRRRARDKTMSWVNPWKGTDDFHMDFSWGYFSVLEFLALAEHGFKVFHVGIMVLCDRIKSITRPEPKSSAKWSTIIGNRPH